MIEIDAEVLLEERDVGVRARPCDERALDLAPGRVAVVQDAAPGVAALAPEREAAATRRVAVGGVEAHAHLHQRRDDAGRALDDVLHHVLVTEPGTRRERVVLVLLEGVVVGEDGGDPALGPARGRVVGRALGDDRHAAVLGHPQRVEETGKSAAEDQELEVAPLGHRGPI